MPREQIRLRRMGIARQDEFVEAQLVVLRDAIRHLLVRHGLALYIRVRIDRHSVVVV